ncbi:N,N-dimethylformamidase beta subunit family domain-containing protein [Rhabdothermincola sp.]|uniref:N,N-dimethylformamidase beta subunit family domain-containing protein n=1 Tax=Rhabdothermincola sp. TaxID=2820405 RepID=UPI002FDFF121
MNPLEDLIRQLDLDPPRPVHPRRHGRIAAVVVTVPVFLVVLAATVRLVGTPATLGDPGGGRPVEAGSAAPAASGSGVERYRGSDWIRIENNRPGTSDWIVPDDPRAWERIRGFANVTSVDHGDPFTLYVSTTAATWQAAAYRIGFYGGSGGRLVWSSGDQPGVAQPPTVVDRKTNMAEAPWQPSLEVRTGPDWPPGVYLLKLTSADGGQSFVPMVVRDDGSDADLLVQSSVTTWQAYNTWGGANLYTGPRGGASTRARVVSFDRPYGGNGSGEFFGREYEFVYFVERLGLDVTYWTDIDLHERPELLARHRGFVSLGHDEYYSTRMRDGLERARDQGVNLAFLGANAIYRKIRLEDSPLGPNRRQVNYRSAAEDPMRGVQDDEVTVSWREPPSNDPESSLIGNYYECNPVKADWVVADASAWMFEGTGFRNGDRVPGMVGNEYDRVTPEAPTPDNIQVIAHSPVTCRGTPSYADSTYYTAPSGAGVFAIGTFWLIPRLIPECPAGPSSSPDCRVQRLTENVLRAFARGPAGNDHPSTNNLASLGIRPGYLRGGRAASQRPPASSSTTSSSTTPPRNRGTERAPSTSPTTSGPATTRPPNTTSTITPGVPDPPGG